MVAPAAAVPHKTSGGLPQRVNMPLELYMHPQPLSLDHLGEQERGGGHRGVGPQAELIGEDAEGWGMMGAARTWSPEAASKHKSCYTLGPGH